MAKYLDTSHISSELMELLKEAKERIILVTYSLQVNTQIQERLRTKSKLGTLGEITLIYGNTKPKQSELQWMADINDLKVFQKKNLHAKCYINENKAIICSMNLYDYSQTTNVEMGFLITKTEDPEAYSKMMDDIDDLRINGDRLMTPWQEIDSVEEKKTIIVATESIKNTANPKSKFSYTQQIKKQLLESLRKRMSPQFRQKAELILPDHEINEIILIEHITNAHLNKILNSDRKVKQIGPEIIGSLEHVNKFVIGQVTDTRYQSDEFTYDQIKMVLIDNGKEEWYYTKKELPQKGAFVAVQLNKNWINWCLMLEETDVEENVSATINKYFTDSNLKSTKELSDISGISSREINNVLVSFGLMLKKGNDWCATLKGEKLGAKQIDGQYGKFIVWPVDILNEIKLN